MTSASLPLLLGAAATVAMLHSILPDHWVPLAVVGRTQRWGLVRVARVSALASAGHVVASVALAGLIAVIGLHFQHQLDVQQGHIVGAVLILTGAGFLIWGLMGQGHRHDHDHDHRHGPDHAHARDTDMSAASARPGHETVARRLAAIAVPFGIAASPDLTILPVALAASAVGGGAVGGG